MDGITVQSLLKISIKNINEIYINKISLHIIKTLSTIDLTLIMTLKLILNKRDKIWASDYFENFFKIHFNRFNIVLTRRKTDRRKIADVSSIPRCTEAPCLTFYVCFNKNDITETLCNSSSPPIKIVNVKSQ